MDVSWKEEAERALGVKLHAHTSSELNGPCPSCGEGVDRLVVFEEGNWWCRQCNRRGWWRAEPVAAAVIEERREQKRTRNMALIAAMNDVRVWVDYHRDVRLDLWEEHGLLEADVNYWGLGYCSEHPYVKGAASLTIPVFYNNCLVDIRHRLLGRTDGDKYRSHIPGLTPSYFNLDAAKRYERIYVVEGEKKAMVLRRFGYWPAIAYPGASFIGMFTKLVERDFTRKGLTFIFAPDPGSMAQVEEQARGVAALGHECFMVDLMDKPDDFVLAYPDAFAACIRYMRRVGGVAARPAPRGFQPQMRVAWAQ